MYYAYIIFKTLNDRNSLRGLDEGCKFFIVIPYRLA